MRPLRRRKLRRRVLRASELSLCGAAARGALQLGRGGLGLTQLRARDVGAMRRLERGRGRPGVRQLFLCGARALRRGERGRGLPGLGEVALRRVPALHPLHCGRGGFGLVERLARHAAPRRRLQLDGADRARALQVAHRAARRGLAPRDTLPQRTLDRDRRRALAAPCARCVGRRAAAPCGLERASFQRRHASVEQLGGQSCVWARGDPYATHSTRSIDSCSPGARRPRGGPR